MPNRILKESICTNEQIDKLSPFDEIVFYRLIVNADDYGIFDGRPSILRSRLFPLKDIRNSQIENAIHNLASVELVSTYEVDGKPFVRLLGWERNQQMRARKSKYPGPDGKHMKSDTTCKQLKSDDIKCSRNPIQSESNPNPTSNPKARARDGGDSVLDAPELQENPYGFSDASGERPDFGTIEAYASSNLRTLTPGNMQELVSFKDDFPDEVIRLAIDQACGCNAPSWNYVRKVLNNWLDKGVKTAADAKADIARGKQQANPPEREREIKWAR